MGGAFFARVSWGRGTVVDGAPLTMFAALTCNERSPASCTVGGVIKRVPNLQRGIREGACLICMGGIRVSEWSVSCSCRRVGVP